jgi:hypothetical protein
MDTMRLTDYLGAPVSALLTNQPFSGWEVERSTEEDLPQTEIRYEFETHGVELICDEAERIRTIFLHRGGDGEALSEVAFSLSRRDVLDRYGSPSESGAAGRIPGLGDHGAWDLFTLPTASLHVQYLLDRDEIGMITLMCHDAVP